MQEKPIIWLESLIGAGKTTLLKYLSSKLNIRAFDEPFEENPYFEKSYKDPKKYAALAQMWFALKRSEIHELATAEVLYGNQYDGAIIDRGLPGDNIFELIHHKNGNINDTEHELYKLFYKNLLSRPKACSMMIYLDVYPEIAMKRIANRNRGAESDITIEYLNDIRKEHYDMIVKIENGMHEWSNKTIVKKIPWNVDRQDPEIIVSIIKKEFPEIKRK